jgi:hypothetical protein
MIAGNNSKTAVQQYLEAYPELEINKQIDLKLLVSVAPDGYLRRVEYNSNQLTGGSPENVCDRI